MLVRRNQTRRGLGRPTTAVLLFASLSTGSLPLTAEAAVPIPIAAYGDADDSASEKYAADMGGLFVSTLAELLKKYPHGGRSPRENAYAALCAVWAGLMVSGTGNVIGLTHLGAAVGGGLGGIAGAALGTFVFPGIGTAKGAVVGGAAGGVAGGSGGLFVAGKLTFAEFVAVAIVTAYAVDYIESKPEYGYSAAAGVGPAPATMLGYVPSRPFASAAAAHAGPFESMFVHMVELSFSDKFLELADRWDNTPGLDAGAKARLQGDLAWMRTPIRRLAEIKRTHKASPKARTAEPLPGWLRAAHQLLTADSEAVRKAWVDALGLGQMDMRLDGGKLTLKTSAELRRVGVPNMIEVPLPQLDKSIKIGPNTLGAKLSLSGGFEVGKAKLVEQGADAGKVEVGFSMGKDETVASGNLGCSGPACPPGSNVTIRLRTDRDISGRVLFRFSGNKLVVDKVTVGELTVVESFGNLPRGPLQDIAHKLRDELKSQARGLLPSSKVSAVYERAAGSAGLALERALKAAPGSVGLYRVDRLESITWTGGKLRLSIRGQRIEWPSLPGAPDPVATLVAQARKPKAAPPSAKPRATTPVAKPHNLPAKGW